MAGIASGSLGRPEAVRSEGADFVQVPSLWRISLAMLSFTVVGPLCKVIEVSMVCVLD